MQGWFDYSGFPTEVSFPVGSFVFQSGQPYLGNQKALMMLMKRQKWLVMKIFPCHFINLDQRSFIRLQKAGEDQKWRPSEELSHSYCPTAQLVLFPSFLPFSHSCCISCWPDWKKWRKVSNFADFDWKLVVNSIWQAHQENQKVSMDKCPSDFISFVKICVFIQWLELILKRGDPTGKETSVLEFNSSLYRQIGKKTPRIRYMLWSVFNTVHGQHSTIITR